ncbi:hypothetical protein DPMN_186602 [Dreissena polymorpha]|uniref:Uncharacterized protein n=1 Tax=Dreissena polymorpha TaxID=45954 RepID=A0A9D4DMH7_DREPO|nr:hypothetical protein DPMN_186602 [Dreissena polymorpha]
MPWELGLPDCTTTPLPTTSHSTNAYAQQQNDGSMVSFHSVLYIGCTTIVMLKQLTIC